MSKFSVRNELPVQEDGAANTCSQREHDDDPFLTLACAKFHFGNSGGVSVIQEDDRTAGFLAEQCLSVRSNPALVNIGGTHDHAIFDDGREGAADRPFPFKMLDNFGYDIGYIVGAR